MNHQPFRDWLLSAEALTDVQKQSLQDHLRHCDSCSRLESSWTELEAVIDRSPLLEPSSGFVERWQVRLVAQQHQQQMQRGWYIIGGTSLIFASLLIVLGIQLWSLIQSPGPYVAALFDRLVGVVSIYFSIKNLVLSYSLPDLPYLLVGMFLLFGIISFMSVLWLATYRKISMARRTV